MSVCCMIGKLCDNIIVLVIMHALRWLPCNVLLLDKEDNYCFPPLLAKC